jgi:hypothetical protein
MIIKVCQFKARQEHGERLAEVFHPGKEGMEKAAAFFMNKSAAPMLPEVQAYLEKLQPSPTKIYVLVNALGAGEYWGSNINGDWFPEASLIHPGPVYGYETFYQAYPYKHHVNKDPSKSFGKVVLSCWNDAMKRVELIVEIDREKARQFGAEDVCDKLDKGMFPDCSMGCKVPYDLCSKCLDWKKYRKAQSTFDPKRHRTVGVAVLEYHKKDPIRGLSVTRNDYCVHLKTMLNKILEDGTKIYAINDYPRFFDISFVFIGADKTAKVMAKLAFDRAAIPSWMVAEELGYVQSDMVFEKVASDGLSDKDRKVAVGEEPTDLDPVRTPENERALTELFQAHRSSMTPAGIATGIDRVRARLREKKASQLKGAEIIKNIVPSQFGGKVLPAGRPDIPTEVLDELGKGDLSEALSTPTTMGMILKPREFQRITIIRMGKKPLADELDQQGLTFPPVAESDKSLPLGTGHFSSVLKRMLLPLMEERSLLEPIARRRIVRITICGKPEEEDDEDLKDAEETPFLQKISAAYNGYLDRLDDCLEDVESVVSRHSDLWAAVHGSGLADGFEKTAAGLNKVSPLVLVGAIGGAYGLNQWARWEKHKAMMGARKPIGVGMDFLAENPKTVMTLAGLGALKQQGSSIPGRLVRGVVAAVKGGAKGAMK